MAEQGNPQDKNKRSSKSVWQKFREMFWRTSDEQDARLLAQINELTQTIEMSPESVTPYVLRGETYLQAKKVHQARDDFQKAIKLADEQIETERWGIVTQAMRDRAEQGLEKAESYL